MCQQTLSFKVSLKFGEAGKGKKDVIFLLIPIDMTKFLKTVVQSKIHHTDNVGVSEIRVNLYETAWR